MLTEYLSNNYWNSEPRLKMYQEKKMYQHTSLPTVKSRETFTTIEPMLITATAPWAILQTNVTERDPNIQTHINTILGCWFHKSSLHYYQELVLNSSSVLKLNPCWTIIHSRCIFPSKHEAICLQQDVNNHVAV